MRQILLSIVGIVMMGLCVVGRVQGHESIDKIEPDLLFKYQSADSAPKFMMPREFTVDREQNIFLFDYMSNRIVKFSPSGKPLTEFGQKGKGDHEFKHLTAIKVFKNRLLALDANGILTFDLEGNFLKRTSFPESVTCEFPKILSQTTFAGEWNHAAELKKILTLRDIKGPELSRLTAYDLRIFFPDLKKGEDFFLNDTYARFFLYDSLGKDGVVWARSDENRIFKFMGNKSIPLITIKATPVTFPKAEQARMRNQQAQLKKQMPSLHMYIPKVYPLIQKLFTGKNEIWVYLFSKERKGLLRFNHNGQENRFYQLPPDLKIRKARIKIIADRIYFMIPGRKSFKILTSPLPGLH